MERIEVQNLTKNYGRTAALKDMSFSLEKGKIYGLLGRNGAGKSTLLRMLLGRIRKTAGKVLFDGKEYLTDSERQNLYLTEPDNLLPGNLKVRELLKLSEDFYPEFRFDEAYADCVDYDLDVTKRYEQLSTGYQSIFRSILALHTHADFIFLDEPTLGHDVIARDTFYRKVLEEYNRSANTILLSTHLIDEVAPLIEEVILIDGGRLLFKQNGEDLLNSYTLLTGPEGAVKEMTKEHRILQERVQGGFVTVIAQGNVGAFSEVPMGVTVRKPLMQELFIALTGKKGEYHESQI